MSAIDVRDFDDGEINKIIFANEADDRFDEANFLEHDHSYPNHIFVKYSDVDYVTLCKKDINNLIKALEKAKEIWK